MQGNFTAIQARVDRSRRLAALADISLVVAVSAAGAGYLIKRKVEVAVNPTNLSLLVAF